MQTSVASVPEALLREALTADVVTYGSPSAVKAWVGLAGLEAANAKVGLRGGSVRPCMYVCVRVRACLFRWAGWLACVGASYWVLGIADMPWRLMGLCSLLCNDVHTSAAVPLASISLVDYLTPTRLHTTSRAPMPIPQTHLPTPNPQRTVTR